AAVDQHIRYATSSDGVRIAYAVMGKGTPVVRASHWLTHLEYELNSPVCGISFSGWPAGIRSCVTTGVAPACPSEAAFRSIHGATTWDTSSIAFRSSVSSCWACHRAAQSR